MKENIGLFNNNNLAQRPKSKFFLDKNTYSFAIPDSDDQDVWLIWTVNVVKACSLQKYYTRGGFVYHFLFSTLRDMEFERCFPK